MLYRTGNMRTPVIMTNRGTQALTELPMSVPVRKAPWLLLNWATKASQECESTTKKQAITRNRSIQPMFSLFFIPYVTFLVVY